MSTTCLPFDIDYWLAESVNHFRALLRIDTTNPPGHEAPAARYIADLLEREGISYSIVEKAPGRSNLVARLTGEGEEGPLLLNGHLDVVPCEREHWRFDPFSAEVADGYIWGRGAIDMKNMVTMSLMTLVAIKRSGIRLKRDIIFAAVADEEDGCGLGSLFLVEQHPELVKASYVLNEVGGQTTHINGQRFYPIQVAEKGICWFELVADGEPGHGSMPHGDNALAKIGRAIDRLATVPLQQDVTPEVRRFFSDLARYSDPTASMLLRGMLVPAFSDFLLSVLRRRDEQQANTFSAMLHNTVSPTMALAGRKVNVIPAKGSAHFDGRMLPGWTAEDFLAGIRSVIGPDLNIQVHRQHEGVSFSSNTDLFDAITATLQCFDPGAVVLPYMNPAFTDSFAYARLGAVCYGFSPVRLGPELNFSQMFHGHNERIPLAGYRWGQRALLHTVISFCASEPVDWLDDLYAEEPHQEVLS